MTADTADRRRRLRRLVDDAMYQAVHNPDTWPRMLDEVVDRFERELFGAGPRNICGWRGFASEDERSGCVRPLGHAGGHGFSDGSGDWPDGASVPGRAADTTDTRDGATLIAAERQRQVTSEGWTPEHDDQHESGELAQAARCYLDAPEVWSPHLPVGWPWEPGAWKPTPADRVCELIKAGALVAAEIDRLQRLAAASSPPAVPHTPNTEET